MKNRIECWGRPLSLQDDTCWHEEPKKPANGTYLIWTTRWKNCLVPVGFWAITGKSGGQWLLYPLHLWLICCLNVSQKLLSKNYYLHDFDLRHWNWSKIYFLTLTLHEYRRLFIPPVLSRESALFRKYGTCNSMFAMHIIIVSVCVFVFFLIKRKMSIFLRFMRQSAVRMYDTPAVGLEEN